MDYLLFESNSPDQNAFTQLHLAGDLAAAGHRVTLVLIQDGIFWAVEEMAQLAELAASRVEILLDEFSITTRGYHDLPLPTFLTFAGAKEIVAVMVRAPAKAIWR